MCEGLKQPRFPSRFQRSVGGERTEERRRTLENGENIGERGHDAHAVSRRARTKKVGRISPRGKGAPRVLRAGNARSFARSEICTCARFFACERRKFEGGHAPHRRQRGRSCKDGGQWSREEEEDLSYETSHNCTPIGPAVECNLSPGRVFAKVIKMHAARRGCIGSQ